MRKIEKKSFTNRGYALDPMGVSILMLRLVKNLGKKVAPGHGMKHLKKKNSQGWNKAKLPLVK